MYNNNVYVQCSILYNYRKVSSMQLEFWTPVPTISHSSLIPIGHLSVIHIREVKHPMFHQSK